MISMINIRWPKLGVYFNLLYFFLTILIPSNGQYFTIHSEEGFTILH